MFFLDLLKTSLTKAANLPVPLDEGGRGPVRKSGDSPVPVPGKEDILVPVPGLHVIGGGLVPVPGLRVIVGGLVLEAGLGHHEDVRIGLGQGLGKEDDRDHGRENAATDQDQDQGSAITETYWSLVTGVYNNKCLK